MDKYDKYITFKGDKVVADFEIAEEWVLLPKSKLKQLVEYDTKLKGENE